MLLGAKTVCTLIKKNGSDPIQIAKENEKNIIKNGIKIILIDGAKEIRNIAVLVGTMTQNIAIARMFKTESRIIIAWFASKKPKNQLLTSNGKNYVLSMIIVVFVVARKKPLQQDHIKPLSRGGDNALDNIQPLCKECNGHKHTRTIDYRK